MCRNMNQMQNKLSANLRLLGVTGEGNGIPRPVQNAPNAEVLLRKRIKLNDLRNELAEKVERRKELKVYLEEDSKSVLEIKRQEKARSDNLKKEIDKIKKEKKRLEEVNSAVKIRQYMGCLIYKHLNIKYKRFYCPEGKKIYIPGRDQENDPNLCKFWDCPKYKKNQQSNNPE